MNMRDHPSRGSSIGAVERDTGLSKDTLRVWERRYGFPKPQRDTFGERAYSAEEVEKLRVIKRLIDQGFRPGKIIELPVAELQQLAQDGSGAGGGAKRRSARRLSAPRVVEADDLDVYMVEIKEHRVDDLRNHFGQAVLRLGLARFIASVVAPLNERVGDAWTRGQFEIFEEHLYTETVQAMLRNAINTIPPPYRRPDVLLTTFPQEAHGFGVLMAEAALALEGCRCVSLGTQTPIPEIVAAAVAHHSDIVALSFSPVLGPNPVLDGLSELRARLPASVEIWAGGTCTVLHRRPPSNVRTFADLAAIAQAVGQWRSVHGVA
jgi:MerR family transcriptional regulator, light-induced transcriptional regulator